jgi:hypothetical protein
VTLRVFVNAPYDKFVGVNTRFWQASGIDAQLSAGGFTLRTQSLATILLGGIAFQAPDDAMGPLAKENTAFLLAQDEAAAMKEPDGPSQTLLMYFNQSLRGLVARRAGRLPRRGDRRGQIDRRRVRPRRARVPHAGAGAGLPRPPAPPRAGESRAPSRASRSRSGCASWPRRACARSCATATC